MAKTWYKNTESKYRKTKEDKKMNMSFLQDEEQESGLDKLVSALTERLRIFFSGEDQAFRFFDIS
jgi:hypothetical protein